MVPKTDYAFPLGIQLTMPDNLRDGEFLATLELLRDLGFSGLELNITDFEKYAPGDFVSLLAGYDLEFRYISTGVYANRNGLSLSADDPAVREKTVAELRKILRFAAEIGCGAICGFIKGGPGGDRREATERIIACLSQLEPSLAGAKTPLLIEATNHYEAPAAWSIPETLAIVSRFDNPWLRVLPDTYHMNIEDGDMFHSFASAFGRYQSVHVSDNNRYFPGFGGIDFFRVLAGLKGLGYKGVIAIEGKTRGPLADDIAYSADYLRRVSDRVRML